MSLKNEYFPRTISHPGGTLKEKLEEMNMSVWELAKLTGNEEHTLIVIVNEKAPITHDIAVEFERVLKIPARFWMRYQAAYDLSFQKVREEKLR